MRNNLFNNLNQVLSSNNRVSSVDVWRGLAIISVVLFHFNNTLPYGSLGVDLFFVISGLLVGGILTKPFLNGEKIGFFNFFVRRGFKIWPSYYTFIILGTIIALLTYNSQNSSQIIPFTDFKRYLLFYQNYTGLPYHWSFDHVWSLCVEEHFYILLPLMFIVLKLIKANWKGLLVSLLILIMLGFMFKILMLYFTNGKDTYSATHNRIDALAWGVLLNLIIFQFSSSIKKFKNIFLVFITGLLGFIASIALDVYSDSIFYHKVVLHSIIPFFFFLMILGTYYYDFSKLKPLRVLGYYSYNWYLWHPVFVVIITQNIGAGFYGLIIYLLTSFIVGVFFTLIIEEPALRMRKLYLTMYKRH
jgi:peptidoglycan/LPS O-acetylase OafA/YrhL